MVRNNVDHRHWQDNVDIFHRQKKAEYRSNADPGVKYLVLLTLMTAGSSQEMSATTYLKAF